MESTKHDKNDNKRKSGKTSIVTDDSLGKLEIK